MTQHRNPAKSHRASLAPYNFVPLPQKILSVGDGIDHQGRKTRPWLHQERYLEGTHSGYLELTIRAQSPIYIRCGPPREHVDDETRTNRHRQNFFHHQDPEYPVIPGSSLRGMTRTLVEILAAGKLQFFSPRQLVYRAVGDRSSLGAVYNRQMGQGVQGGYLRRDQGSWSIQPARSHRGHSFVRILYSAAEAIGIRPHPAGDPYDPSDLIKVDVRVPHTSAARPLPDIRQGGVQRASGPVPAGYTRAVLVRSGDLRGKKRHCAIFEPAKNRRTIPIRRETWKTYAKDRDLHRGLPTRELDDGAPVFYLEDGGEVVFFGPTRMFRLPYPQTVDSMLPSSQDDAPDLAEAIFGTVDSETPFKGRVFFEDAPWDAEHEHPFLQPGDQGLRSPKLLTGPKATAFQHYLVQSQPDNPKGLLHWGSEPGQTQVRGFKRYWHQPEARPEDMFEDDLQIDHQMGTVIRPVRPDMVFSSRVRFDNLTDLELGALLTALDLPPTMRHHLGMGKPHGMGTVRVEVTPRLIDRKRRYSSLVGEAGACETGALAEEAAAAIRTRCREVFEAALLAQDPLPSQDRAGGLWAIPRLADLALLLDHRGGGATETRYCRPADRDNLRWWRERRVLPTPHGVLGRPQPEPPPASKPLAGHHGSRRSEKSGPPKVDDRGVWETLPKSEWTKKGNWRFRHRQSGVRGVLHPQSARPDELEPGQEIELTVRADGREYSLEWRRES